MSPFYPTLHPFPPQYTRNQDGQFLSNPEELYLRPVSPRTLEAHKLAFDKQLQLYSP